MSKGSRNRSNASAKIAEMRAAEARRQRRQRLLIGAGAVVVVAAVAVGITLGVSGGSSASGGSHSSPHLKTTSISSLGHLEPAPAPGQASFEGVPIPAAPVLASTATRTNGQRVDGISCDTHEQLLYHIHAHLTIFANGSPRQVPAGIGIPGSQTQNTSQGPEAVGGTCIYWLHTHAPDGVIHIESPIHRTYTLGDFFDEWGQPLGPGQVGPDKGHVTAIYNGQVYQGNPRDIPLNAHAQIQLEVGSSLVAPEHITWPGGL
jgi:hypothetical protein